MFWFTSKFITYTNLHWIINIFLAMLFQWHIMKVNEYREYFGQLSSYYFFLWISNNKFFQLLFAISKTMFKGNIINNKIYNVYITVPSSFHIAPQYASVIMWNMHWMTFVISINYLQLGPISCPKSLNSKWKNGFWLERENPWVTCEAFQSTKFQDPRTYLITCVPQT